MLHLLISVTITFGTIPNLLANNVYPLLDNENKIKNHNIKKRNASKSLLELSSTVDIGDIELFDIDEEHIRNRLVALNHSIFDRIKKIEVLEKNSEIE